MSIPQKSVTAKHDLPPTRDRFTLSYMLWACACLIPFVLGDALDLQFHLYLLLVPITGLPILAFVVYFISALWLNLVRQQWRRSVSVIAAPVLALLFFYLLGRSGVSPALITFELNKSEFLHEVAALPKTYGSPRMKVWNWGSTGGAGVVNTTYLLVYDESDQINQVELAPSARSPDWEERADAAAAGNAFVSILHPEFYTDDIQPYLARTGVKHLEGHFYLVTHND